MHLIFFLFLFLLQKLDEASQKQIHNNIKVFFLLEGYEDVQWRMKLCDALLMSKRGKSKIVYGGYQDDVSRYK